MLNVVTAFAIIFVVIGAGFVLSRTGVIGTGEARLQLNRIAFYAATPALIFSNVSVSDNSAFFSPVVLVIGASSFATMALFWTLSRLFFRRDVPNTMAGAAASCYYNSVNIGLPVATYVIGDATYVVPALVLQMTVVSPIVIAGLNANGTGGVRAVVKSMVSGLTAPVVVAAIAGALVAESGLAIPDPVLAPLKILGGASIPLILMSFGASLNGSAVLHDDPVPTLIATLLKLVGMPLIAWAVATALGLEGTHLYAALILATLPTAQNVYNYTATYGAGTTVARDTVLLTTFLSMPAMLLIAAAFR
ncbi:AEC family transporter [Corynebacterium capitovis]|uniref:AEC family transporter n=1 Tax=Corynebacterium capitovis TaxID=131081 RepID=UPI00035EA94F|nr:AEC family transporter [Corynebacterium capitovis]